MAELIIQNPSITPNVFEYDEAGRVSAISGYPLAGEGGGEVVKSDLMWKPTVGSDGYVRWTLASSATTPDAAYISGAKGADGTAGFSPTIELTPVTSDAHNNGGTQVDITYKNGETTATASYTAWNGNDGEGATVNLFGNNGVSVTKDSTNYTVGLSGGYYSDTLSAYSAMYAGYVSNAKFSDNSVSSMDQIKGSIDWCNQIANEYATHSGNFVTSSSQVITGDKQYGLTTAGWAEIDIPEAGGEYLPLSGGTVSGSTYFSAANGKNVVAVASAATLIGASRQTSAHFGTDNNAIGTTWVGVNGDGSNRGFLKYINGGNVGDLNGQGVQVEFGGNAGGEMLLKTDTTDVNTTTKVINVPMSGYNNMTDFDATNGPNYMLRKLSDGRFDIGAKVVNVTEVPTATDPNTYYFVYDIT